MQRALWLLFGNGRMYLQHQNALYEGRHAADYDAMLSTFYYGCKCVDRQNVYNQTENDRCCKHIHRMQRNIWKHIIT